MRSMSPRWGLSMIEDGGLHSLMPVRRATLLRWTGILSLLIAIWAASGFGYFWPMWVALGAWFELGAEAAERSARLRTTRRARIAARQAGASIVVGLGIVAIWVMAGGGYFWPVWPLMGMATMFVLVTPPRPRRRSLEHRVGDLERTRRGALDVQATELRRIERDLHDGAQARLVALSMQLGRAEERLSDNPETAALVRRAREEATAAIAELRDLARGIAPPVLADRGLVAAVRSLADRASVEVEVGGELVDRPPPAVETAAYFVVAEALTNVAKHAPGSRAKVTLARDGAMLVVEVADNGPGGADPKGGGMTGLRQRVEALDGRLDVHSAAGEGTVVWAVMPCE